jgi:hypothetical protein
MRYVTRLLIILLFISASIFGYTFLVKDRLISIPKVHPSTLSDPIQTPIVSPTGVVFTKSGYEYSMTPSNDYKISGVVVDITDYKQGDNASRDVFRFDVCMVWGKNVSSKVYLSSDVSFYQDGRYCQVTSRTTTFNLTEVSNNHLITPDDKIVDKVKSIHKGDEVVITGKLVNAHIEQKDGKTPVPLHNDNWNSSLVRDDFGCEVILVSSVDILTAAHGAEVMANDYALRAIIILSVILGLRLLTFMTFANYKRSENYLR